MRDSLWLVHAFCYYYISKLKCQQNLIKNVPFSPKKALQLCHVCFTILLQFQDLNLMAVALMEGQYVHDTPHHDCSNVKRTILASQYMVVVVFAPLSNSFSHKVSCSYTEVIELHAKSLQILFTSALKELQNVLSNWDAHIISQLTRERMTIFFGGGGLSWRKLSRLQKVTFDCKPVLVTR